MEEKKGKILVVDDEPEIVSTLKDYLSNKGYEVIGALSGEEALGVLEKEKTDLILMDIMMPGIKGTDASRIIKQKYPSAKVLILTGYPKETEDLLKDNVLEGVFTKPVRLKELYNKLLELIGPAEAQTPALSSKQGITARVLLIKAKLLFLESSFEIYDQLQVRFRALAKRGENYTLDLAHHQDQISEKIASFVPDLLLVNATFIKEIEDGLFSEILEKNTGSSEILVYTITDPSQIKESEVERLIKAAEAYCFKHGLIEVKWVEI
ncbi:MAG: response regulator [Candidatus Omnitrophica bacterium]|nr:response regulator [Candidatus Omnitrophota bacterium]